MKLETSAIPRLNEQSRAKWAVILQVQAKSTLILAFPESLRFVNKSLTLSAERAIVASDRSRFAALPTRYLEDVGLTEAERVSALALEETTIDPWRVVASHL